MTTLRELLAASSLRLRPGVRRAAVTCTRDLRYRPGSTHPRHRLDVYRPAGELRGAPVVHFVHGGYWIAGDRSYLGPFTGLYASIGRTLAARGVVTVIQSYRLVPEVAFDEQRADVEAAVAFTMRSAVTWGGDPARVVVMGHSAGGHHAALLATDPARAPGVRGFVALSAIWDVAGMSEAHAHDARFQRRVTHRVFGHDPARWRACSPLARIDARTRPLLVMVGDRDYPYLVPQAERAKERLAAAGAPFTYRVLPGYTHDAMVLRFGTHADDLTPAILRFLE